MLRPNYEYVHNNNHYFTDRLVRTDWFYGRAIDNKASRDLNAQRNLENKAPGENAGHIIAARHNGYGAGANLVRQDEKVNQRDVAAFERGTDEILRDGKEVRLYGSISYINESNQPAAFSYTRETMAPNGINVEDVEHVSFTNMDMSIYEGQPENDHWAALAEEHDNPNAVIVDDHNQIQTELAGALTDDNLEDTDGLSDTDEISLGL